jgi:hypothetical protein
LQDWKTERYKDIIKSGTASATFKKHIDEIHYWIFSKGSFDKLRNNFGRMVILEE